MRIVVTGVAGFLGSNLLDRLLDEGHEVIGVDDLSMGPKRNIAHRLDDPQFRFIEADVTDEAALGVIDGPIDRVVHLAAFKIPRYGKAIDTLRINYEGTTNALELARRAGCKAIVASTSDVYGRNPSLPFSELHSDSVIGSSRSPRWAYAVSKLFDEHLAFAYQDAYGFPVTLLRFFGSYGPRQHLGWWGGPPPVFIDLVLKGEPVTVHGDGSQTRTFTYVDDTTEGMYRSIVMSEADGEVLNIGGTEEVSILRFAEIVHEVSGVGGELRVEFVPYESFTGKPYEDVMRRVPDTSYARDRIGFEAKVDLREGLRRTIAWQREVTGT